MEENKRKSEEQKQVDKLQGGNIGKYRRIARMKQKELAEIINVSRTTLSNWERGATRPDEEKLRLIANALGVEKQILKN